MRKFLSLVLALVMMMSLVTINAGAKEFTDGDDITYDEAVDVISTIHVVDGYTDGGFRPSANLSRGAAAKIICNMILGPTTAAELHADTAPYRDVPVTSEFAGYIAYCQKEGIISGYADGTFRPAGTLTGYAFMKMLLGALGYDSEIEQYTGPNWSINVAKRAIGIGLNKGLVDTFNGVNYVTREEACLYAFNTLQADLVEYDTKITANVNGAEVIVGNSNATSRGWNSQATRYDNIRQDNIVQFAEEYFNRLVLTEDMDAFGRPDREWRYDGEDIGSYINMELFKAEYTTEITGKDLYDLLGSKVVDVDTGYHFEIHVDGEEAKDVLNGNSDGDVFYFSQGNMLRTNTKGIGGTGNGVLTQVFVDNDKDVETVYIAVINTYLAIAADDYDEKREEAEFEVYSLEDIATGVLVKNTNDSDSGKAGKQPYTEDLTVKNEDIDVEDVKDGDIVLVRVAEGAIQEIIQPEVIAETEISSFKNGTWVKADEQYNYADSTTYDPEVLDSYVDNNMKDTLYNLYLDPFGYMIGIEIVEATTNYLFLTGIDGDTSNLANKTARGNIILLDGTMDTVTIRLADSRYADGTTDMTHTSAHPLNSLMNTWCKYTVNKNGEYVLNEVANTAGTFNGSKAGQSHVGDTTSGATTFTYNTIDKKHVSTPGITGSDVQMAYGNDDTVYITVSTGLITATLPNAYVPGPNSAFIIDDVESVTVGVQNANLKAFTAHQIWDEANSNGTTGGISDTTAVLGVNNDPNKLDSIANGVYNLFDIDGALIAAIVVGEDDGTTTNYAYVISSSMTQESWDKNEEEWTWSRKVIINGEITEVIEITDGKNPAIQSMTRGCWYEMKYKSDGTVRSATKIDWDEDVDDTPATYTFWAQNDDDGNKFIGLVKKVQDAVVNNDTVVLAADLTSTNDGGVHTVPVGPGYYAINPDTRYTNGIEANGNYTITTTGNTLWISTNGANIKDGFAVRNDAKVVMVQDTHVWRNGVVTKTNVMENQYEYSQTGKEALAKMVKDLMDNENFVGFISAVFEGGVATSVVVWDQTPEDIYTGNDPVVAPGDPDTTTVHLQYIDSSTMQQINVGKTVVDMAAGDKIYGDNLIGYICQVPSREVVVPVFQAGTTELTLTLLYDPIAGGAAPSDDQGAAPALPSSITDLTDVPGQPDEDDSFDNSAWDADGDGGIIKDTNESSDTEGETFIGNDAKGAFEAEAASWGPGIYHYTQEMQDLFGWNRNGTGQVWFQIGEDQDVDTAVILVTIDLASDASGYTLYLDNVAVPGGNSLWTGATGVKFLCWDGIPVGTHTYKLVANTSGEIVQAGTFTMTASNA